MEKPLYKVLLIEDSRADQELFKWLVKNEDLPYDLTIVASVKETKKVLPTRKFDIIVSDYKLGDGTAFDILDIDKDIPSIFITGMGNEEIAVNAMKAGAYDYIVKDFEGNYLKLLPTIIERVIRLKHNEDQYRMLTDLLFSVLANTFDAIAVADLSGKIVYFNNSLEKISKYSEEELSNLFISDIMINPEFTTYIIESCKKEKRIINFKTTMVPKTGSLVPVALSAALIKMHDNILISMHDLRVETELTEELKQFRLFVTKQINCTLFKIGKIGPLVLKTEPLPLSQVAKEVVLNKMGAYYATALGMGAQKNTGLFGPFPVPGIGDYEGMIYSFIKEDPLSKDPRNKGKSYAFIVFSMPKNLVHLFNNRISISQIIEKRLNSVPTINEIDLDFLISLKYQLLELEHEEPISILIINKKGLNVFIKAFIGENIFKDQAIGDLLIEKSIMSRKIGSTSEYVERIKHKEYNILIKQKEPLFFCYIYKSWSSDAEQKIDNFITTLRDSQIWGAITKTTPILTAELKESIEEITGKIFLAETSS